MSRHACPDCHAPLRRHRLGKDGRCPRCRRVLFEQAFAAGSRWARRQHQRTQPKTGE